MQAMARSSGLVPKRKPNCWIQPAESRHTADVLERRGFRGRGLERGGQEIQGCLCFLQSCFGNRAVEFAALAG